MTRTDDPFPLIKRLRSMGMSDAVILNRLVLEGWAEGDIRHAFEGRTALFASASPTGPEMVPPAPPVPVAQAPASYTPPPVPAVMQKQTTALVRFSRTLSLSPLALGVVA